MRGPVLLALLLSHSVTGCSVVNPGDLPALDFRGEWLLAAVHQDEPELSIHYRFTLDRNEAAEFEALAEQFILDISLWNGPRTVSGKVFFDERQLRFEFSYPPFDLEPEVALVDFRRATNSSSRVVVEPVSYRGFAVGIVRPGGDITGYDTETVFMEQLSDDTQ